MHFAAISLSQQYKNWGIFSEYDLVRHYGCHINQTWDSPTMHEVLSNVCAQFYPCHHWLSYKLLKIG